LTFPTLLTAANGLDGKDGRMVAEEYKTSFTGTTPDLFPSHGAAARKAEGLDAAYYAPNGGRLFSRNLNHDSTHPNPWRPPTIFEATLPGRSDFMNLEQWTQPTFVKTQMGFENTELTEKLRYYGTRGILLGNVFGVHDVCFIESSKKLTAMGKFARWAYVLSPWPAMALTYVGSHHMINMKASEKNATWTYGAAAIPTAGIWGAYKRAWGPGIRVAILGGLAAMIIKELHENGLMDTRMSSRTDSRMVGYTDKEDLVSPANDPSMGFAKPTSRFAEAWKSKDVPVYPIRGYDEERAEQKWDIEPSWKKHLPDEEKNRGPQS